MANIRLIKRRIKTAKNTAQITKAMELVAASKMRKAQSQAIAGKLYAQRIYEMVMRLSSKVDYVNHPLLQKPEQTTGKRLVVLISTNKGLCGGLNANLLRFFLHEYGQVQNQDYITMGRKGADFMTRAGVRLMADFSQTLPFENNVAALTKLIVTEFAAKKYDGVDLVYNDFVSVLRQESVRKTILPLALKMEAPQNDNLTDFIIEPDPTTVFNLLLPHYLETQILDGVLEAQASEHSARMVAMRNATDNAMSLLEDLTLIYNKARQEKITYEISDMVTARLAVEA